MLIYTLAGSIILLLAIIKIYAEFGLTDLLTIREAKGSVFLHEIIYLGAILAMGVKIPIMPFHL